MISKVPRNSLGPHRYLSDGKHSYYLLSVYVSKSTKMNLPVNQFTLAQRHPHVEGFCLRNWRHLSWRWKILYPLTAPRLTMAAFRRRFFELQSFFFYFNYELIFPPLSIRYCPCDAALLRCS